MRRDSKQDRQNCFQRCPLDKLHVFQHPSLTISELKVAASGLWSQLIQDAGGFGAEQLDGRGHPCPRCGGRDRFAAFRDVDLRGSVHCRSCFHAGTNPRPGDGIATIRWLLNCDTTSACQWIAGRLGLVDVPMVSGPLPLSRSVPLRRHGKHVGHFAHFASYCHRVMKYGWWSRLEDSLGIPSAGLIRLGVGWSAEHNATTWPMSDESNMVVGVRLRSMRTGRKWSVPGGKAGFFLPKDLSKGMDRLFVTEGATDTAAFLSLGFDCIGRPSCNGAVSIATSIVKRLRPKEVVIVADADINGAGQRGADSLALALTPVCPRVRIIYPQDEINDARQWVCEGATAEDVMKIVRAAEVRSLKLCREASS